MHNESHPDQIIHRSKNGYRYQYHGEHGLFSENTAEQKYHQLINSAAPESLMAKNFFPFEKYSTVFQHRLHKCKPQL